VHFGRKKLQPPRETLREFTKEAAQRLEFAPLWFDDAKWQALGDSIAQVVRRKGYTVWACAVLKNHVHLCVRRHRDDAKTMWEAFVEDTCVGLRLFADIPDAHPVWSERPYKVFLYTPDDVRRVIAYIGKNPVKEGLGPQNWAFVSPYYGWPLKGASR
jgi:REP element-mobilizing transposase RayT